MPLGSVWAPSWVPVGVVLGYPACLGGTRDCQEIFRKKVKSAPCRNPINCNRKTTFPMLLVGPIARKTAPSHAPCDLFFRRFCIFWGPCAGPVDSKACCFWVSRPRSCSRAAPVKYGTIIVGVFLRVCLCLGHGTDFRLRLLP